MCNHDPNDKNTSIIFSKKRCMIYPMKYIGICKDCHKTFIYIKNNDGKFTLKEGD